MCSLALLLLIGNIFCLFSKTPEVFADNADSSFGGFSETDFEVSPEDQAAGIDLHTVTSTLEIGTPSLSANVEPGGTAYAKSNVTYSVSGVAGEVSAWSLGVSYANGKSALAFEGTGTGTTMTGAGGAALTDNKWGYAWTDSSTTTQPSAYNTMPDYGSPKAVDSGTSTQSSTTGAIHFAAKFATNAVAGHYKTQVLLSLVATPKVTYTLTLNANNGSGGPGTQTCTTTGNSCDITISSMKPTRTGYDFLGWADSSSATTSQYSAGGKITLSANKTIYAVWKTQVTGIKSIQNMQQMTSAVCTASAVGDKATLTDTRDSSTYTVEKLKDGKCWMTQNLRLINKAITSADSDVSANFTTPASATWTDTSYTTPHAYYNNNTIYGAYYNWYAATAGTGTSSVSSGDASSSICPKGWRLPKGTPGAGTNELAVVAGLTSTNIAAGTNYWSRLLSPSFASNALIVNGATWPAAGQINVNNGSLYNVGSTGGYWSSTASSSNDVYELYFRSGDFYPSETYSKLHGLSIRCIAR